MARVRSMKGMWAVVAVALSVSLMPCAVEGATKVRARVVEFDVRGATPSEVAASLFRGGLRAPNGQTAIALTSASFWIDITPVQRGEHCVVGAVTISVDVVINMPRLADASRLPPKVRRVLTAFVRDVLRHERGHQSLKVAAGRKMDKEINGLPPQRSCMEVRQKAQAVMVRINKESHRENQEYDERERRAFLEGKWAFSSVR